MFLALIFISLVWLRSSEGNSSFPGECIQSMFNEDAHNYGVLSCRAQRALQRNWYPDPIGGLFSYQTWNGMDGFWQNGIVLETMTNALKYGNHSRYLSVIKSSLRNLDSLLLAYGPEPSFDDMAWYGLAYSRIFEVFKFDEFLRVAKDIFSWCWENGWDSSGQCNGGVWFDNNFNAKQTIENAQMFQLGLKLANLDPKAYDSKQYSDRALKVLKFIEESGIVDQDSHKVYDGISLSSCRVEDRNTIYTYTAGTMIGGFVEFFRLTKDEKFLTNATNIADAVLKYLTKDGVLTEICDPTDSCSLDARSFKGFFLRNLRYLMDADSSAREKYLPFVERNVAALTANGSCTPEVTHRRYNDCHIIYLDGPPVYNKTGPVFGSAWNLPVKEARPMEQAAALDLLNASISPKIRCVDAKNCRFDPPNPPPIKLTCKDNPCPKDVDCCQFESSSFTCCSPGQTCSYGICE